MKVVFCASISVLVHMLLGWEWTVAAGFLCGLMVESRNGLWGAISVGLGWAVLVVINVLAAPESIGRMLEITGQILGNLPGGIVVVLTIFIGGLIGMFGGLMGGQLARLIPSLRLYKQQPA